MAFSVINSVSAQSTDTNGFTSGAIDTSTSDLLVMAVADYAATTESTISDTYSNNWLQAQVEYDPTTTVVRLRMLYAKQAIVGTGHQFIATVTGGFPALAVIALSGSAPNPNGATTGNNGTAVNTLSPGNITPTSDNWILVTALAHTLPSTVATIDSGFTIQEQLQNQSGIAFGLALAYLIQTTATSETPTWSMNNNETTAANMCGFRVPFGQRFLLTPF